MGKPIDEGVRLEPIGAGISSERTDLGARNLSFGPIVLDCDRYAVQVAGRAIALTRLEFDLLEFLVKHSNRVVSHGELLQKIVGRTAGESGSLIRVHVAHLRKKLGAASVMIRTVRGRGFLFSLDSLGG